MIEIDAMGTIHTHKFILRYPILCLVTDPTIPDLVTKVKAALAAGVNMLQLRGHRLSASELYQLALGIRRLCRDYRVAFIVNDRIDVGLAVAADGFQLGKQSLPLTVARQLLGDGYLLGASVHSVAQAQAAAGDGADFLLAGTIFVSSSHPNEPASGTVLLQHIKQALPHCPLVAIGGITHANVLPTMLAGADGVATISAILHTQNIERVVQALLSRMTGREE